MPHLVLLALQLLLQQTARCGVSDVRQRPVLLGGGGRPRAVMFRGLRIGAAVRRGQESQKSDEFISKPIENDDIASKIQFEGLYK